MERLGLHLEIDLRVDLGLAETQHYLSMTPELLREASRRFESSIVVGITVRPSPQP